MEPAAELGRGPAVLGLLVTTTGASAVAMLMRMLADGEWPPVGWSPVPATARAAPAPGVTPQSAAAVDVGAAAEDVCESGDTLSESWVALSPQPQPQSPMPPPAQTADEAVAARAAVPQARRTEAVTLPLGDRGLQIEAEVFECGSSSESESEPVDYVAVPRARSAKPASQSSESWVSVSPDPVRPPGAAAASGAGPAGALAARLSSMLALGRRRAEHDPSAAHPALAGWEKTRSWEASDEAADAYRPSSTSPVFYGADYAREGDRDGGGGPGSARSLHPHP